MAEFIDKNHNFASIAEQEYADKLLLLAMTIEKQTQERLMECKMDCTANMLNAVTKIKLGKKYDKIDLGGSGKLMVVKETGEVFGVKAYGVIHKGHAYGTLDTISEWYWGDYHPMKRKRLTGIWERLPESGWKPISVRECERIEQKFADLDKQKTKLFHQQHKAYQIAILDILEIWTQADVRNAANQRTGG